MTIAPCASARSNLGARFWGRAKEAALRMEAGETCHAGKGKKTRGSKSICCQNRFHFPRPRVLLPNFTYATSLRIESHPGCVPGGPPYGPYPSSPAGLPTGSEDGPGPQARVLPRPCLARPRAGWFALPPGPPPPPPMCQALPGPPSPIPHSGDPVPRAISASSLKTVRKHACRPAPPPAPRRETPIAPR